ncbi:hypothetical protein [uncultured Polaribacter sp.]|uniref:hypothetical protein n=1 Tax=uncultured Polaribacter sp. TaxID=174711 RepID=UPI0026243C48|nr:hypothetical protein [uncultured Polaribacter sp.]
MFYKGILKILILILCANSIQKSFAQKVRIIDNKGTLKTIINNKVTTSETAPETALLGDIWFDNTIIDKIKTKIYDGTNWKLVNTKVELLLDLTNSQKLALILPTETSTSEITTPTDGMLLYSSGNNNAYLRSENTWKPIAYNSVKNELIFDGDDDADSSNDNYRYVSLIVNGNWKVIRYNKNDINVEDVATINNNPSQSTQPTSLAVCASLTY